MNGMTREAMTQAEGVHTHPRTTMRLMKVCHSRFGGMPHDQ